MCRYFVTLCLYNPSLYHIIVLCLRARESLSTSPSGDESGLHLTNVDQYSPFLSATFAMTSEDQDDIHFVQDPSISFRAAIHSFSSSVIIYSCRQSKSSNLQTDFLGLRKASKLVDNGINEFLLMSFINSNEQNFQK